MRLFSFKLNMTFLPQSNATKRACHSRRLSDGYTHVVDCETARQVLEDAYRTSKGIIDYIGDYALSGEENGTYREETFKLVSAKAEDESINTNNPLLMLRNADGTCTFFLYINGGLVPLVKLPY